MLGRGAYGTVYFGLDKNNEEVAIKNIEIDADEGLPSNVVREIIILKQVYLRLK